MSHDESEFVEKLAKECTSLRLDDWAKGTINVFFKNLNKMIGTVLTFNDSKLLDSVNVSQSYQLTFLSDDGTETVKTFEKVKQTKRGKLLSSEIETALEEMGDSISVGEKRQILMSHLEKLC